MLTIHIDAAKLAAVSHFSSVKDLRHYLNGVLVEANDKESRLVATDGHALAACRFAVNNSVDDTISIIVPSDVVSLIVKSAKLNNGNASIEFHDGAWNARFGNGQSASFTPIDARFPEWRRVVPDTTDGQTAQFDPILLARFVKAAKSLGRPNAALIIQHNGGSGALATLGGVEDFFGVIMPLNNAKLGAVASTAWCRA